VAGGIEPLDSLQKYHLYHIYLLHHLTLSLFVRNSLQIVHNALSFASLHVLTSRKS
jgi:hypothetical protein